MYCAPVNVKDIKEKAQNEHKRKVSQLDGIQNDIAQYFSNEEAEKLASEITEEINPTNFSNKHLITLDSILDKAMNLRKRRKSEVMGPDFVGLTFDQEDVTTITKDVIKNMFAAKKFASDGKMDDVKKMSDRLENELKVKDEEIEKLKNKLENLKKSKTMLAINSNKALNDMRGYLMEYQKVVFKADA